MKKILFLLISMTVSVSAFADYVFDSTQAPIEVKLAPAINSTQTAQPVATLVPAVSTAKDTVKNNTKTIKEEKFNNAIVNLDDAQVELRQELAVITAKYNEALNEKEKVLSNCKSLKKEMNAINKKMKNVDKSKKMINKNLENSN